jgi:hypothetical protein
MVADVALSTDALMTGGLGTACICQAHYNATMQVENIIPFKVTVFWIAAMR